MSYKSSVLPMKTPDCRFAYVSKIYKCTDHITDLPRITAALALEIITNLRYEVQFMNQILSCFREVPSEQLQVNRTVPAFTLVGGTDQHHNVTYI